MSENIFALAARKKFRFATPQGSISVEDLWDLPLTSPRANQANLDSIAIALDKEIKASGETKSFVTKTTKTNDELKAKFEIVLHIIEVKQQEAELATVARENAARKQRLMELIEHKKDEALAGKSLEELNALLSTL